MDALKKHVATIRELAARHHPDDEDAQEMFTRHHLTVAARTLGSTDPEGDADNAFDFPDTDEQEDDAPAREVRTPVAAAKAPRKKTAKKRKG